MEWREGTNETLSSWFIALRVRAAHNDHLTSTLRATQWLLVEWPEGEAPTKYSLGTLPASTPIKELVHNLKMRYQIERDYQELKDELAGLNHYEGRNWRGFHHHASLCIAAYAFLVAERLTHPEGEKKTPRAIAL